MLTRTTHPYSTSLSGVPLTLDIFLPSSPNLISPSHPALLYFHGGGLVGMSKESIPPHIVQSCIRRSWPLISVDYDLLPQVGGESLVSNVKDSYAWVRENLRGVVSGGKEGGVWEGIVVGGNSAGGYLTYQAGHYCTPKPLALLSYYGPPSCQFEFYNSSHQIFPLTYSSIEHFLAPDAITFGETPREMAFYRESLLDDGSPDPSFKAPEPLNDGKMIRAMLYAWLVQENMMGPLLKGSDKALDDPAWKNYPPTIIIHGDKDSIVPYYCSEDALGAIGPEKAKLFTVPGIDHAFDASLLLGDEGLAIVEQAWRALDEIVASELAK